MLFQNKTTGQTVAKNAFWLGVSNLGGRLIKAVIIIYSARILGAHEWGLFSYAVSFAALITIFTDFGIGPILTKEASRTDDPTKKAQIISTAFFMKAALLLIAVLIVIFIAPSLSTIKEATFLFPIISLIIVFDTFQGLGFSLIRALEKMEWEAGFYLLTNILIVIFGFLTLRFYPNVQFFSYAYAAGIGIGAIATLFSLRHYFKKIFSNFKLKLVRSILGASWPFVISSVLGSLMINTDILLIGYFLSAKEVGLYSAADRIVQFLYLLPAILATSVFPTLSRLANKNQERIKGVVEKILSMAYLISLPIVLGGIVLGGDMIRVIFGGAYAGSVLPLRILFATLSINFAAVIMSNIIFAYDRQRDLVKFAALGGLSNVVFDLILIPRFGISGSAVATFFAQVIANIYIWNKARKLVDFSVLPKLKKIVMASAVMAIIIFGLHRVGLNLFVNIGVGMTLYFGLLYLMKESLLKNLRAILRGNVLDEPINNEPVA